MTSKYLILAIILLLDFSEGCEFNIEGDATLCTSLASAVREASPEWGTLKVKNFGNQTLAPLRYKDLQKTPNLQNLLIHGVLNGINKNSLKWCKKLQKLELFNNVLESIPRELFHDVPIENVYLINNSLKVLHPGTFQNSEKLKVLYIRNNSIKVIPSDVFSGSNIKELYIENNYVEKIEDFAFINMDKLFRLSLSGNNLKEFDVKKILGSNSLNLDRVWLSKNNLSTIKKDMFALLPKLKYLFLEMNAITVVESGAFKNLQKLVALDISNNNIWVFPPSIFPDKALSLEIFLMHNNRVTFFENDLFDNTPSLKYVSFYGNPMQCPCNFLIESYFGERNISHVCKDNKKQQRPICLYTPELSTDCSYDMKKNKELFFEYVEMTKEWAPWEPKCNFAEGYEGLNWSNPYINRAGHL